MYIGYCQEVTFIFPTNLFVTFTDLQLLICVTFYEKNSRIVYVQIYH